MTDIVLIKVEKFFMKNYTYLIVDRETKKTSIIDPALEYNKIKKEIEESGVIPENILLTHHHQDHISLAGRISKDYDIPIYMSEQEVSFYKMKLNNLVTFNKNSQINTGNSKIIPIITPGHTKGGTCYYIDKNLFTGDTLFTEGCGICYGPGADPNEMFESLQLLKMIIPADTKVFPGHSYHKDPGMLFSYLLENNIYLHIKKKEHFIKFRMRKNQKNILQFR